jgi:hypothetical protein
VVDLTKVQACAHAVVVAQATCQYGIKIDVEPVENALREALHGVEDIEGAFDKAIEDAHTLTNYRYVF